METQININYVKTDPDISFKQKNLLDKIIRKHALIAGRVLNIPFVTITVYPKSNWAMPERGEDGYASSGDWIQIYIDPKNKNNSFEFIINNLIPGTIYHEMNHVARWRSVGFGKILPEVVVTEGLASVFEKEQWKKIIPPWAQWNKREISDFLETIKKRNKKNDLTYNHSEWFFGRGKLPRWIGYKLGVYIVESMRKNFSKVTWRELTKMKADEIIKKSGVKI